MKAIYPALALALLVLPLVGCDASKTTNNNNPNPGPVDPTGGTTYAVKAAGSAVGVPGGFQGTDSSQCTTMTGMNDPVVVACSSVTWEARDLTGAQVIPPQAGQVGRTVTILTALLVPGVTYEVTQEVFATDRQTFSRQGYRVIIPVGAPARLTNAIRVEQVGVR